MTYVKFLTILHLYIEQYGTQPIKLRISNYNIIGILIDAGILSPGNIPPLVSQFHGLEVVYDDNIKGDHLVLEGPGSALYQVPTNFTITESTGPTSMVSWIESVWFYC